MNEYFFNDQISAAQMDYLWARGWRHFGEYFFRYSHVGKNHVTPLRIDLATFKLTTSLKRILKMNTDIKVVIREAFLDEEKEALFQRHKIRFTENVPDSIFDFLSATPAHIPCETKEVCLFQNGRLIGTSFLDLGENSTSSVYSIYEPEITKRSLGIFLILNSIRYSMELGKRHYYLGYAYREPSHYDYKKRFLGLEVYEWETQWIANNS
jgi:leucyl-tRNA---protein transferase